MHWKSVNLGKVLKIHALKNGKNFLSGYGAVRTMKNVAGARIFYLLPNQEANPDMRFIKSHDMRDFALSLFSCGVPVFTSPLSPFCHPRSLSFPSHKAPCVIATLAQKYYVPSRFGTGFLEYLFL